MRIAIRASLGAFIVGAAGCQDVDKAVPVAPTAPSVAAYAIQSSSTRILLSPAESVSP